VRLVERDSDLAGLASLLGDARAGRGRIALVRGEAGIGKTTLVRSFTDSMAGDSFILWGVCDDLLAARPLGPVWDMATREPSLAKAVATGDRNRVFEIFFDLLTRSLRPTVAVIDDVQWADESTLDLITFIGRRIESTHGLLLLTYRDGAVHGEHPLRSVLGSLPHGLVARIAMQPLSQEGVMQLVGNEAQASKLWTVTRGNPLFLAEVMASGDESVPMSIRDALSSRVNRLTRGGRDLVELAAVVPGRIELAVVDKILGDVAGAVEESEAAGILELHGDALAFRHEIARRAIESELSAIRRRDLNRAVLEAIEVMDFDVSRRAHHARASGDVSAMLSLFPEAARHAAALESHREAVAMLRELEPYVDRMSLEEQADHYDFWAFEEYLVTAAEGIIEQAIELRREMGDVSGLGQSLLMASRIAWQHSKRSQAVQLAEEAARVLEPVGGDDLAMAYSTISQLAMIASDEDRAVTYADQALSLVGPGPSRTRLHSLNNKGSAKMINHFPDGIDRLEESFRLANELGLAYDALRAGVNLAWGYLLHLEPAQAERWLNECSSLVSTTEMPTFESHVNALWGLLEAIKGDWGRSEERVRAVLGVGAFQEPTAALAESVLADILVRRGVTGSWKAVEDAWERAKRTDEIQHIARAGSIIAEYAWLGGSVDDTLIGELRDVLDRCVRLKARLLTGELAIWLRLADMIHEVPDGSWEPFAWLGAGDWRRAAEWFSTRGVPYWRAVALSVGNDEAKLEALAIAESLGARPLSSVLRSELAAAGVRGVPKRSIPAPPTTGVEVLTARQLEVLQLLGEGLANADIADRLFLSTRTVDHHVSAILTRLEAKNRSQAVHIARRAQLLP
jgi:DNA-binding CsgD family transcriptional regulator/tetratricopeptide (TPR) repeat protein